jgi:starch phosphorylase
LAPLGDIVANLRWSWHPDSLDLLESVDPELWSECNGDPARLLGGVSTGRLEALAKDRKFLRRLQDVSDDLRDYLEQPRWYQRQQEAEPGSLPSSVAYFSPEFGITEVRPLTSERRSSGSACCTAPATSPSRCPGRAGSRNATRRWIHRDCR